MSVKTEPAFAEEAIINEANGFLSRDAITLVSGQNLKACAALGKITVGTASGAAMGSNTGNGTMGAVTVSAGAMAGVYALTVIEPAANLGAFMVQDPLGATIGHGTVGSVFTAGGISFTLADGATDFVSGDQFAITVVAGSGKYTALNPAAADGSQNFAAMLLEDCDASSADKATAAITRNAELNRSEVGWNTMTTNQINAAVLQAAALGIIVRSAS
jgi:hypothetical protein